MHEDDLKKRDQQMENNLTLNIYAEMYEKITYTVNYGDIGQVKMCLLQWVPLFEAVGKRKYTHQTLKLVYELNYIFPAQTRQVVCEVHSSSSHKRSTAMLFV